MNATHDFDESLQDDGASHDRHGMLYVPGHSSIGDSPAVKLGGHAADTRPIPVGSIGKAISLRCVNQAGSNAGRMKTDMANVPLLAKGQIRYW